MFHFFLEIAFRDQVFVSVQQQKLRLFPCHFTNYLPNPRHPSEKKETRLCLEEGTADLSAALPGAEVLLLALDDVGGLLDEFLTLGQDEFDVARVGHVGVDLDLLVPFFFFLQEVDDIHDRGHGRCVSVPWGPG